MAYVKSFVAGILTAAALAVLLFLGSKYRAFQRTPVDVHLTDFHFPKWVPIGVAKVLVSMRLHLWFNVALILVLLAFVVGFSWELHRVSMRTDSSFR